MSIKFICSCGKHLRAREEMAGRRSVCPQCGQLVGVPALMPTQRGTSLAPMTPNERTRTSALIALPRSEPPQSPLDNAIPAGATKPRRSRRALALEKHWYQCLWFPFDAWRAVVPLAQVMTVLSGLTIVQWQQHADFLELPWLLQFAVILVISVTIGYACGIFNCVLASAAAGETGFVRWPGFDLRVVFRALAAWLVSFLAGPIVFAAAALAFWYHAGDLGTLDSFILAELCVVGTTHWLLGLVAIHQADRWRDAHPLRIGAVIRRLGYGAVFATLGAATVALGFGLIILQALVMLHEEPVKGWCMLAATWIAALAWAAFFFRLLGIWCFRSRVEADDQALRNSITSNLPSTLTSV